MWYIYIPELKVEVDNTPIEVEEALESTANAKEQETKIKDDIWAINEKDRQVSSL